MELTVIAYGRPAPQGSKKRGASGQLQEASRYLPAWRSAVKLAAQRSRLAARWVTTRYPVSVSGIIFVARPANPEPENQDYPAQKPDLDKLERAILDALTQAGVYVDDQQVVDLLISKRYAGCPLTLDPLDRPGARLFIKDLPRGE